MASNDTQRNVDYKYFLMLDRHIFESIKFLIIERHFKNGKHYLVSFLKLSLEALPSGWISYEAIKEELKDDTDEFIEGLVKYQLLEQVDNMFHSYLVKNKYVKAKPLNDRDRDTIQYKEWRRKVFERDDYTCQKCGKRGTKLNAHHIVHWAYDKDKRYDVSNGITLCETCHKLVHKEERQHGK